MSIGTVTAAGLADARRGTKRAPRDVSHGRGARGGGAGDDGGASCRAPREKNAEGESAKTRLDAPGESASAVRLRAPQREDATRESTLSFESAMVEDAVDAVVSVSSSSRGAAPDAQRLQREGDAMVLDGGLASTTRGATLASERAPRVQGVVRAVKVTGIRRFGETTLPRVDGGGDDAARQKNVGHLSSPLLKRGTRNRGLDDSTKTDG